MTVNGENMHTSERVILGILLGMIPITIGLLAGWWISIPFVAESHVVFYAIGGICIGILIDIIFLKTWLKRIYSAKPFVWLGIYLYYSICEFGFFMGVPVFHVLLALPAGFFIAGLLLHESATVDRKRRVISQSSLWISFILAIVCLTSGTFALLSPSTGSELQHMLRLPFQISVPMLVGIIVTGGVFLLALQWFIFRKSVACSYRYLAKQGNH
jgi:hypothetical protein